MIEWSLDKETYKVLYAKYLVSSPDKMIKLANLSKNKHAKIVDLCCGNGRLGRRIREMYPKSHEIHFVDSDPSMMVPDKDNWVKDAKIWLNECATRSYNDVIFCQQAINYIFDDELVRLVEKALKQNGLFIFNTFNKKPSSVAKPKIYEYNGMSYIEISWLVGDIVKHVQICEGYDPHFTEFKWISPDYFLNILNCYFSVKVHRTGHTDIYVCEKK